MGRLIRAISENGGVLFCAVDATDIVRRAEQLHKTSAVTSAALGRLLAAGAMMGRHAEKPRRFAHPARQGGRPGRAFAGGGRRRGAR